MKELVPKKLIQSQILERSKFTIFVITMVITIFMSSMYGNQITEGRKLDRH